MIKIFNFIIPDKIIYTTLTLAVAYLIYKLVLSLLERALAQRGRGKEHFFVLLHGETRRLEAPGLSR
jgi:hypothetical protein